jgi:hypothetical protein
MSPTKPAPLREPVVLGWREYVALPALGIAAVRASGGSPSAARPGSASG